MSPLNDVKASITSSFYLTKQTSFRIAMKQRIGVYICHCGGNISDYVDVEQLSKLIANEDNVVISKDVMFACSDSTQKDMVQDINDQKLDAIVVASCTPKLHTHTFTRRLMFANSVLGLTPISQWMQPLKRMDLFVQE